MGLNDVFKWFPDWGNDVTVEYQFQTVISTLEHRKEQRKALVSIPFRKESFTITEKGSSVPAMMDFLRKFQGAFFQVPLFTEPIIPVGNINLQNQYRIDTNSILDYYNTMNCMECVAFFDLNEKIEPEIKGIDGIFLDGLILSSELIGAFDGSSTIIYPLIYSYLLDKSHEAITDQLFSCKLSFQEKVYDRKYAELEEREDLIIQEVTENSDADWILQEIIEETSDIIQEAANA